MKLIILLVTLLPTLYEAWTDRYGETRKDKKKDTLWLLIAAACLIVLLWFVFDIHPLWTGLLLLMWRFCTFDYLTHWFLKRYSPGHSDINVFSYTGTVAFTDRLTAKIPPVIRFVIRVLFFLGSIILYAKF